MPSVLLATTITRCSIMGPPRYNSRSPLNGLLPSITSKSSDSNGLNITVYKNNNCDHNTFKTKLVAKASKPSWKTNSFKSCNFCTSIIALNAGAPTQTSFTCTKPMLSLMRVQNALGSSLLTTMLSTRM
jgi:hypothetical protein